MNVFMSSAIKIIFLILLMTFVYHKDLSAQQTAPSSKQISSKALFEQTRDYASTGFIVKLKKSLSPGHQKQALSKISFKKNLRLKKSFPEMHLHHMILNKKEDLKDTLQELKANTNVEYAEPDYYFRKIDEALSDGPIQTFSKEEVVSGFKFGTANTYQQTGAQAQVTEAWMRMSTLPSGSVPPLVAIIDTGLDLTHPVYVESHALWVNENEIPENGLDDDNNGYVDDVNGWNFLTESAAIYDDDGHGTHVAGIVLGATMDIFADPLKEAPIKIMPLKFLGADGSGTTSQAIQAIYYAVNNGAKVLNNSWGGYNYSSALHDALTYAYDQGVLIVTAAGNFNTNNDVTPIYPANLVEIPSLISTAATNDWDNLAVFSNYGQKSVHFAAPGVSVLSTMPRGRFGFSSGTSMAAPFVSGLAALIWRETPQLTGFQIKQMILDSVDQTEKLSQYVETSGRVDALKSMNLAIGSNQASAYQPGYVIQYRAEPERGIASSNDSDKGPMGCGTVGSGSVTALQAERLRALSQKAPEYWSRIILVLLLFLPVVFWSVLRKRTEVAVPIRRRYDRFAIRSDITIMVGGREMVASMKTISVGGMSFEQAEAMLEKGGQLSMQITSPDGREKVTIDGHVVWNEKNQAYGIEFDNTKDAVRTLIQSWTAQLKKI